MTSLAQFVVNAVAISSLYALVAIGFTLVFGVGNVLNFGHAGFLTVGAYAAYQVSNPVAWGLPAWSGVAASMAVGAVVGGLTYWVIVRYVVHDAVVSAIVTLLFGFVLIFTVQTHYGSQAIQIQSPTPGVTTLGGIELQNHFVFVFVLSWLLLLGIYGLLTWTRTGRAIVGTSMTRRGAVLVGIDVDRINVLTWTLAGALAGGGGALLVVFRTGGPFVGIEPMVLSFAIVILGGLGSVRGSVVGAYIVGFLETATITYGDPTLTGVSSLLVLIGVLLIRPTGLFGREAFE